jgi:hypothetical protein
VFDQVFAGIATSFSDTFGGPFADAQAIWPGVPVKDDGGSIVSPATPIQKPCKAQVCAPTEGMRADAGFLEKDMRIVVLSATLDGALDTSADVVIAAGPHAGRWDLQSALLDTAGIGWVCRGRKV